jgi:hypothetical protein
MGNKPPLELALKAILKRQLELQAMGNKAQPAPALKAIPKP